MTNHNVPSPPWIREIDEEHSTIHPEAVTVAAESMECTPDVGNQPDPKKCIVRMIRLCPIYGRIHRMNRFSTTIITTGSPCEYENTEMMNDCEIYREIQSGIKFLAK